MRARVHKAVGVVVVREVRVVGAAPPRKLQHHHPRRADLTPQRLHVRRDHPEVLRHDLRGGVAEPPAYGVKEPDARAFAPVANHRRLGRGVHGPVPRKRPEVVDPRLVVHLHHATARPLVRDCHHAVRTHVPATSMLSSAALRRSTECTPTSAMAAVQQRGHVLQTGGARLPSGGP